MGMFSWIPVVGDVIDAFTDMVGTSQTNDVNLQSVRETNQAQKELAEYQWEQNIQQWKRENEYNSPEQQMQRLAAAGLNPYLVYQNGNAIMPAGNSPNYEAPNLQAYHQDAAPIQGIGKGVSQAGATMFDSYMREEMQEAQLNKMWYDNEYQIARTRTETQKEQIAILDKALKAGLITRQDIENTYLPDILMGNILETAANTAKTNEDIENLKTTRSYIEAQTAAEQARTELTEKQQQLLQKEMEKYDAEIRNIEQLINTGKAQEAYYKAQAIGQQLNNWWNERFGTNAPWYVKMFDKFLEDPVGSIQRFKSLYDLVSGGKKIGLSYMPGIKQQIGLGLGKLNSFFDRTLWSTPLGIPWYGLRLSSGGLDRVRRK